ncbi:hypothetical protein ACQ86G_24080 [Roseateles chitinivorans]|uniref:hypothetical protein n=1 Tax=Roseateles chitinivorans TaxID=2917965 RepID=UPI003D667E13
MTPNISTTVSPVAPTAAAASSASAEPTSNSSIALHEPSTAESAEAAAAAAAIAAPAPLSRRLVAFHALLIIAVAGLASTFPSHALDLVAFSGITGPLTSALTQISALGPGIKALVGFVGFVVALISLSAMRNFSSVLFYVGLAIFAAVGLVIAGAIMGAVV